MIHVMATVEVVPGKREAFLSAFDANVPHVKAEDGCLAYGATCRRAVLTLQELP